VTVELLLARDTRPFAVRLYGFFLALTGLSLLFATVLVCNFLQCSSLLIWPFSRRAFRAANRLIAGSWWALCVLWVRYVIRVKVDQTGDDVPEGENAIVFANHQQMPDILMLMFLAQPKGRLGDLKWFVKDILKYVPGLGWGMLFLDCLFVKRDWAADRQRIENTFKKYRSARISFWLISFVESTRITPAKLLRAQEFAQKRGEYVPQLTLVPRSRGFIASVQGLGERAAAVYDVTIAFEGGIPKLWAFMSGITPRVALHLDRYSRQSLPQGEDQDVQLARWLSQRFIEKDARLIRFRQTGRLE
jgi:1-acyl-sn-glycerol-3-phosphate acyltransferase